MKVMCVCSITYSAHGLILRSLIGSPSQLCDTIPTAPKRGCGGTIRLGYVYPFTTGWPPPPVPHPTRTKSPTRKYAKRLFFFSRSFPPVTAQRPQPNDQRNAKNPQSLARHRCAQRFQFRSPPPRACNVLTPCPVLFFFFS